MALLSNFSFSFELLDGEGRLPNEILRERSRGADAERRLYRDEVPPPIDILELRVIFLVGGLITFYLDCTNGSSNFHEYQISNEELFSLQLLGGMNFVDISMSMWCFFF